MSIYGISDRTKKNLSTCVGVPYESIVNLSLDEEIELASKNHSSKIVFSKKRSGSHVGRGNPLLARKKIKLIQEIEAKITKVR